MFLEDPSDHVFIDFDTEGIRNLLRNLEAPKLWVAPLYVDHRGNEFFRRSLGSRLSAALRGIKPPVFAPH